MNVNNSKGLSVYELYVDELDGKIIQIKAPHKQEFIEVVCCKDCKWFRVEDWGEMWCAHTNGLTICLESYCSDGQRRDEDETD